MTPTPEEIALAELIARDVTEESGGYIFNAAHDAALTAIMEVTAAAADALENAWNESELAERVRKGEHLR